MAASEFAAPVVTLAASFEVLPAIPVPSFPHFPIQSLHSQNVAPRAIVVLKLLVSVAHNLTLIAAEASSALLEVGLHRRAEVATTETSWGSAEVSWGRVVAVGAS